MKEEIRIEKGVTLISLIVTIIILIILAGIGIRAITSQNGIIQKTGEVIDMRKIADEMSELQLSYLNMTLREGVKNSPRKDITVQDLRKCLEDNNVNATLEIYGKLLKVTFNQTNNIYTISCAGDIEVFDSSIPPIYGTISEVIIKSLDSENSNGLYYHSNLENSAEDNSYRFSGGNPKNYIRFNDELWRIIGVIPTEEVNEKGETTTKKLVKIINTNFTTTDTVKWDDNAGDIWANSTLQRSLNSNVSGGYLNKLENVSNYITNVNWKVSGVKTGNNQDIINLYAKTFYDKEVKNATEVLARKVGLMYVSDYAYAIAPKYWQRSLFFYDGTQSETNPTRDSAVYQSNWMWATMGNTMEWTITRNSNNSNQAYRISDYGAVYPNNTNAVSAALKRLARAVVYLEEDVLCKGIEGTAENPYTIIREEEIR